MSTIPYLKTTTTGLYKYRRRLPKDLEGFFNSKELIRSLGNNEIEATKKALSITSVLNEAIELTKLSSIPKSVIFDLLSDKLQLKSTTVKPKPQYKSKLSYLSKLYIEQSNVSVLEHSKRIYFLQSLLPSLLEVLFKKNDININSLSYEKILMIRKLLVKMPNMNYGNFKTMNLISLISRLHKNTLVIPEKHLLSTETVNKNLKRIKSILIFAQDLGTYTNSIPKSITIQSKETSSRDYKAILTDEELEKLLLNTPLDIRYIFEVLYFTGMRRSELYKCKVIKVDGVLCFDLRSPSSKLKTKSSYRTIPVHNKLFYRIDEFNIIVNNLKPERLTKNFTRIAKNVLEDTECKSLYSLRHTFATNLVAKGVQPEIVSELMGHAHSTMTMSRYVKGYPLIVLKEAIDKLKFINF